MTLTKWGDFMIEWHIKTPEELERLLETDLEKGLSNDTASLRGTEKKNILFAKKQKSKMHYAKQMMIVLLPLLVLVTAVAALATGEETVGYTLLFSAAFCIAMLFAAYSRARYQIETAEEAAASSCRVLRGGEYVILPHEALVTGDLVYLQKGDFVPADCRLIRSAKLTVQENGITAHTLCEKNAAISSCGDIYEAANMLWAGTAVESGVGIALVCHVGDETHFRATLEAAKTVGFEETQLYKQLKKLSFVMTASLFGFLFLSAVLGFVSLTRGDFFQNWMLIATFSSSAMADFYGVFAYIAAGHALYGVQSGKKKLREGILLKRGDTIETMASVDRVFVTPEWFVAPFSAKMVYLSEPFGRGEVFGKTLAPYAQHVLRDAALAIGEGCNTATAHKQQESETADEVLLRAAIRESLMKNKDAGDMTRDFSVISVGKTPKGISYGVILREGRFVVTLLAASNTLVPLCSYAYRDGKLMEIDAQRRERIFESEQHLLYDCEESVRTCYTVCVTYLDSMPDNGVLTDRFVETALASRLAVEGFVVLETPFHKPSVTALRDTRRKGMGTVLFCETEKDRRIAAKLGLVEKKPTPLDKGESCAIVSATVAEKLALLRYAKKNGETVAYAGDGFEELFHMKEASLSMKLAAWQFADEKTVVGKGTARERERARQLEQYGCDAFRYSADLLVSHPKTVIKQDGTVTGRGGFYALCETIRHAGAFFCNVRGVFAYLSFSAAVKLIPAVLSLFLPSPLVLPEHLAVIGLVLDPLIVLSLALSPPSSRAIAYRRHRNPITGIMMRTALAGFVCGGMITALSFLLPTQKNVTLDFVASALFVLSLTAFLLQSALLKQPFSRLGIGTLLISLLAFVSFFFMQEEFHLMSILYLLLLWVLSLAVEMVALTVKKENG